VSNCSLGSGLDLVLIISRILITLKNEENAPKTIPAQTKQITFISYYAGKKNKKNVNVQKRQFITMSSVMLPPRALPPGKVTSDRQWYRYVDVIPPQE